MPSPPALLTAAASLYPLTQTMPAWMIGYCMLNNDVILLFIVLNRFELLLPVKLISFYHLANDYLSILLNTQNQILPEVLNLKFFTRTLIFTILALIAFAANSVLCRFALHDALIDPASFTSIRLISGATILLMLVYVSKSKHQSSTKGSWASGAILFLYAVTFSFAYISLDTGTGALIAFATVQITMITSALFQGEKMTSPEWIGVLLAFSGLVYLVFPGVTAPSLTGLLLMIISGTAWGLYSLRGKSSMNSLGDTAFNFLRALPFVIVLLLFSLDNVKAEPKGIILAIVSGALTSGIGYTIWYMALKGLSAFQASIVQLIVPVIAAAGGVLFLSEIISLRLIFASLLILGGLAIAILKRKK